jgi:hypothetical protein
VLAQVTVADIAATIAIPFVLRPDRAAEAAVGLLLLAVSVIAIWSLARAVRGRDLVLALRPADRGGFGPGLMVAAIGGPKRLSTQVLGVAGWFFVPLFFIVLGARIDLGGPVQDPWERRRWLEGRTHSPGSGKPRRHGRPSQARRLDLRSFPKQQFGPARLAAGSPARSLDA